ncbi:14199_t:CDS:2, partial [Gigaspora rosea]
STPPPEWTYLGFLKAIKPYCIISEARSIVDQKAIWRKRHGCRSSHCILRSFAVVQLGEGVVPPKRLCELSRRPPEEDFWNEVKIEKQLINKEVCMDIEWNLLDLDCNLYPSTSKAILDKKSQMGALEILDISRPQKVKEYVNNISSKIGLKQTHKQSLTPPNKHAKLSDNENEANESTSEEDSFLDQRDLKAMTFDEFVKGFKNESNWRLKDGHRIIDVLTANVVRVANKEFQNGMYTWFKDDWYDIKKKVYETIDMEPKSYEDNAKVMIDTVEEIRFKKESLKIRQIATIYFHVIDKFLEDPYIFIDKLGKPRDLTEIEYVINMTGPILDDVFSDVKSLIRLR